MNFLRRQWIGLMLIVAIAVSFVVGQSQSRTDNEQVRASAISECQKTSGSAALVVAFKLAVADSARARGEEKRAANYEKLARGGLDLIPLPADAQAFRPQIPVNLVTEGDHFVISDEATELMREGCRDSYDPNAGR